MNYIKTDYLEFGEPRYAHVHGRYVRAWRKPLIFVRRCGYSPCSGFYHYSGGLRQDTCAALRWGASSSGVRAEACLQRRSFLRHGCARAPFHTHSRLGRVVLLCTKTKHVVDQVHTLQKAPPGLLQTLQLRQKRPGHGQWPAAARERMSHWRADPGAWQPDPDEAQLAQEYDSDTVFVKLDDNVLQLNQKDEDLRSCFGQFGKIINVEIPLEYGGQSHKGYAFVTFKECRQAGQAWCHARPLVHGRLCRVKKARPRAVARPAGMNRHAKDPSELTSWFENRSVSAEHVLDLASSHMQILDAIAAATALHHLAKRIKDSEELHVIVADWRFCSLVKQTAKLAPQMHGQACANTLWALAKLEMLDETSEVSQGCWYAAEQILQQPGAYVKSFDLTLICRT